MSNLTTPLPADQATDYGYCTDCGEELTIDDMLDELNIHEDSPLEDLLLVSFTNGEDVIAWKDWFNRSTHFEVVVEVAAEFIEETGLDLTDFELFHIHRFAENCPESGYFAYSEAEQLL